ncbi:hypothetical protein N7474_006992 [Penicillium riverlandense]|uniref:uncharacterized protein n=1 Tax=Penicillium riverlandense TaxID=1903569 RepID=UPI0025490E05|nr:uncharacterized protein N7474_006992 [Penicillium riverlandense]KAJ5815215.1 hypothetical protein N7474_006992 [Penicillium riverlandense]
MLRQRMGDTIVIAQGSCREPIVAELRTPRMIGDQRLTVISQSATHALDSVFSFNDRRSLVAWAYPGNVTTALGLLSLDRLSKFSAIYEKQILATPRTDSRIKPFSPSDRTEIFSFGTLEIRGMTLPRC